MKKLSCLLRPLVAAAVSSFSLLALAQSPAPRLTGALAGGSRVTLVGSKSPHALAANDLGAAPSSMAVNGITLVFNRSANQEAALQALLTAQQTPGSPQFHQWLTPDQFAEQFGIADSDISTVETWLQAQGFTVKGVARSRNRITFSGTAGQVASAFGAELHRYQTPSGVHFAPSADLSLPQALAPLVTSVSNLSDFRPKPEVRFASSRPELTSSITQAHFLDPLDVATQYDVNSLYTAGFTGTGQSIAIAGQSYIETADVQNFLTALNITNHPATQMVLVPGTGTSAIYADGDEAESDIDVEYSSAMGRGATVNFVYVGDSVNYSAFDAMVYAVTEDVAPIISLSYGACEQDLASSDLGSYVQITEQANTQGQTIVAAAGDSGSTNCYGDTDLSPAQQETPSADFPADLVTVTGMGGLQMQSGTYTTGNTQYFSAAGATDTLSSLLSYVPETVWNEGSAAVGILAGGGGASAIVSRPTWQAGVAGIPSGTTRLVPDLSLQASTDSPGYVFCSSDPTALGGTQTSSCTSGLRDSSTSDYTIAGGTSFAAPIFAGMLSVLNQAKISDGQGNVNPTLYTLASNGTSYASAFHDITTGGNQCIAGTAYCSTAGAAVYAAGTGYDEASGLGSVDMASLVSAWPSTAASSLNATSIALTVAASATSGTDQATIAVTSLTGASPTGTVELLLDGAVIDQALALTSGSATATFTVPTPTGTHILTAIYSGDPANAPSRASAAVNVGSALPSGTFTLTASGISLDYNSSGSGTVTVIPASGYGGLVNLSISGSTSLSLCYSAGPISTDASAAPFSTTLSIGEGTACTDSAARSGSGAMRMLTPARTGNPANTPVAASKLPAHPSQRWPAPTALAGLLLGGFALRRKARRMPALLSLALLLVVGLGLSGCGGGSSTAPVVPVNSPQTLTVTLTGADSVQPSITSSTTFTLTIN